MTDLTQLARRLDELEQRVEKAESERDKAEQERDQYRQLYLETMERCRKLELGLIGQKSERLRNDDAQLSLSVLDMLLGERQAAKIDEMIADITAEGASVVIRPRPKPTGRKPLPEHLPRFDIEIIPPEVQREGLDAYERIGQEVTEVVERRPASMVVARVIRPKFVRKDRDREDKTEVLVGATPELPIPRGLAGPGMLADTLVKRWQDHLPLHRLEGIYARDGLELARSTMCGWHAELAKLVQPLIDAMREDAFAQPYLCTDATGVLVQAKDKCRTGHFWVLVAPELHVLFEYTPDHTGHAVDEILAGYEGYLVADAHAVYDHLYKDGDVIEVNCWAHARRYFFKALGSEPERAKAALGMIQALFRIERSLAGSPRKKKERIRAKRSKPIIERFFSWCDAEAEHVLDETPLAAAIRYARNQRAGLVRFLDDGRLPIHNNLSEMNLRRQAVGRKNWLFVGSDDAGAVNAVFTSLLASCAMCRVEPWAYLRDLLCVLPSWPVHRVLELAPAHWNETRQRDETQALLATNPFRRIAIASAH